MEAQRKPSGLRSVSIRFSEALLDRLRHLAAQDKRSLNAEVLWILESYVDQREGNAHAR